MEDGNFLFADRMKMGALGEGILVLVGGGKIGRESIVLSNGNERGAVAV